MLINQKCQENAFFFINNELLEGLSPVFERKYAEGRKKERNNNTIK